MFEKRPLEVKPVARYDVPRYPRHDDPDPTRHPEPVPFPFGAKIVQAAASLGITASLLSGTAFADDAATDAEPAPPHPLTVAQSGLPYTPSPYGTGVPSRLDEKIAREVIDDLFRAAGYAVKHDQRIEREGISFVADGYDPDNKVGYVFASWTDIEGDAFDPWWARDRADSTAPMTEAEAGIHKISRWLSEDQQKALTAAQALEDPKLRDEQLQKILDEFGRDRISMTEAKAIEAAAPKRKEHIAIISQFDRRFSYQSWGDEETQKAMAEAQKIPDPAKRAVAVKAAEKLAARTALENLETSVREYLDWVRRQGG